MLTITKKSRNIINLVGVPLILSCIYYETLFPILVLSVLFFSAIEYVELVKKLHASINKFFFLSACIAVYINSIISYTEMTDLITILFVITLMYEMMISRKSSVSNVGYFLFGIVWLSICLSNSLIILRSLADGLLYTYLLFISIWVCDTFAYIFGSKFGHSKIAPSVSPNKTWFGCISGYMGVFVVLTCLYYLNYLNTLGLVNIFVMSIILGVVSQIGDFLESFIKRSADIKDTSNILLGHGGFLDRFDSISFAAPFYVIYILNFL